MFIDVIEVVGIVSVTVEVECDSSVEKEKSHWNEGNFNEGWNTSLENNA